MKVAKDLVVSLAYQVRTEDGVLVDESPVSAPLDYLHGHGSLISGLETALEGHEVGDKFDVAVGANDAYGQYDENLVQRVPKDVFMGVDELQVGMRFLAETDQGPVPVEITAVEDDHVVVDGNHMLAGQNLKFNVEVVAIREATEEELAHGHVHGAHDHHHDHDHEEHEHHHEHDHEEHEHHHDHDHEGHDHHHHHHADEVFTSWGMETPKTFTKDKIAQCLSALSDQETYGIILRAKGIVPGEDGQWIHFVYVPGEPDIRTGAAGVIGRLCVIGSKINEAAIAALFQG